MKLFHIKKNGNDTLVNFIYDNNTSKISSTFLEVKDVKLPTVFKFTYPESREFVNVTIVYYDWSSNSYETLSSISVLMDKNTISALNKRRSKLGEFLVAGAAIYTAIELTSGAVGIAFAVYAAAPMLTTIAATTGALLILDAVVNKTHASEIKPEDIPYPPKTKIENPKPETFKDEVITNDCTAVLIKFGANMDSQGNILLFGGEGGTAPYTYRLEGTNEYLPVAVYTS